MIKYYVQMRQMLELINQEFMYINDDKGYMYTKQNFINNIKNGILVIYFINDTVTVHK